MDIRKQDQFPIYQIKIKGHLENGWSDWFENLAIHLETDGNTLLEGPIVDQAVLYGILKKVHQLGLQLISVNKIEAEENDTTQKRDVQKDFLKPKTSSHLENQSIIEKEKNK